LELTAAVVSVRVSAHLKKELEYERITETFWTDSQVVLGYIKNTSKRFHIFVGNRVQEIHDRSKPDQWYYVNTEVNPADAASGGLTARQLVYNSQWLTGPAFLWKKNMEETPAQPNTHALEPNDPEVKKVLATQVNEGFPSYFESNRLNKFSDLQRAKRAVAHCIQLQRRLRNKELCEEALPNKSPKTSRSGLGKISVDELKAAEREVLRSIQREHFQEEINAVHSLKSNGNLWKGTQRNHATRT
jgi:hypothetical protein